MYASIIEEYLNTTKYTLWSILSILQYIESNHGLSIDNVSILEDEIYARLHHHQQRPNMQQRAINKLKTLLNDQHQWFNTIEVESFMDELQKKEEKESDDENASDIASESDIIHSDVEEKMHELNYPEELEESTNKREDESDEKWILSTGKDVYEVLNEFKSKIPPTNAYLYPAYFGILDLSGEEPEVMELFTAEEWAEMKTDFDKTVVLKEMDTTEEALLYDLFDKIEQVLEKKNQRTSSRISRSGHLKINVIRRVIQTYVYNLDRLKPPMSESSFSITLPGCSHYQ
ncbi:hypothetical protein G9A89_018295 [Geosiphon pyriformis]|nr:hypothetical protein G9A89_018295 [Geosiphon pyriformis]